MMNITECLKQNRIESVEVIDNMITFPLMLDSAGKRELSSMKKNGESSDATISVASIVNNAHITDQETYAHAQRAISEELKIDSTKDFRINSTLEMILFQVAPAFASFDRNPFKEESVKERVLRGIKEKYGYQVPDKFKEKAKRNSDISRLDNLLSELDSMIAGSSFKLDEGIYSLKQLDSKLAGMLRTRALNEAQADIKKKGDYIKNKKEQAIEQVGLLLYLDSLSEIKLGDFGLIKSGSVYRVYKATGEYALMDFDERVYEFDSARVYTDCDSENPCCGPKVMESYTHPFLNNIKSSNSSICVRHANYSTRSPADRIISVINTGINTLLRGYYNEGSFNGFRTLDGKRNQSRYLDDKDRYSRFNSFRTTEKRLEAKGIPITNKHLIKR